MALLFALVLLCAIPSAWGGPSDGRATARVLQLTNDAGADFNIIVNNTAGANISIVINNIDTDAEVYYNESTDTVIIWPVTLVNSLYQFTINQSDAGIILNERYTAGSVFDSGFKDVVMDNIGREAVVITVLFGVALVAVALGRWAGLPIVFSAVLILAQFEYGAPSWLLAVIVIPAVAFVSYALYKVLGGEA